MSNRRTTARAFTLLEMLVATAIMAVLAGSLYATLHIAFRARQSAMSTVERTRRTEYALATLRADIQAAVMPTGILAGEFLGQPSTDTLGRAADALALHCIAPASAAGAGDIRMVQFTCEQAADGTGLALVRRVTTNLLATTATEAEAEVLCRRVYAFALLYFDGTEWLDTWDSTTQDNQLPAAVEVTLRLESDRSADDRLADGRLTDDRSTETDTGGYVTSCIFVIPCSTIQAGTTTEVAAP